MAEFTDNDKRTLDMLRKALLERRGSTLPTLAPWQESISHQPSVPSDKGAIPADVVRGLSGSWAASYAFDRGCSVVSGGSIDSQVYAEPGALPARSHTSRLGLLGVPEINFPLYNARTNAFGTKGPALIGSPISFEVVGPTLKSPACDWTWSISLTSGPNGGDELTMSTRADGVAATCSTLAQAYNLASFTMGDLNEPNGGLYIIIVDDGTADSSLPVGVLPMAPNSSTTDTARYEIFRVASAQGGTFEIHPNKPFRGTFNVVAGAYGVKGLMLVRPYATRLAALPSQIRGREQNFVVVAPQRAAGGDLYPPYNGGVVGDGTWLQGGYTELTAPGSGNAVGSPVVYQGRQALPIPTPIGEYVGIVEIGPGTTTSQEVGLWVVTLPAPAPADLIRHVIHLYQVSRVDDTSQLLYGTEQACLGFFEIRSVSGNDLILARVPEVDPITGRVFYGPGPYVQTAAGDQILCYFTVHRSITELFTGPISADDIESSRLAPLLAPSWTERSSKQRTAATEGLPSGSSRARPDRAIFDTYTYVPPAGGLPSPSDPGNLLDLGFRMVLFPAKEDPTTGLPIADFAHPITSREVIIDPSVNGPQYLEVDYDAGIVRLSHAPPLVAGGDIVPNGVVASATSNPRNEVILYACTVPYTLEASQRGMGPAITTKRGGAFSVPIQANISAPLTNYVGIPPYFTASNVLPNPVEIVLDQVWEGPPTGMVEIVEGGPGGRSFGVWSYTEFRTVTIGPVNVSGLSLLASSPQATDPTPGVGETRTVILRREVLPGITSSTNATAVDDYISDRAYGQALRGSALRLPRDNIFLDVDGAVAIATGPAFSWAEKTVGYLAPSKLPFPPRDPTLATPVDSYFGETGLFCGIDYEVPAGDPRAPTPGGPFRRFFEGSSIELAATQVGVNWHGIVTAPETLGDGIIRLNQGFRLSVRFQVEFNSIGQRATFFIGFVQDEGPGPSVNPTVDEATRGSAMNARFSAVGLFGSGSTGDLSFWGRGSDGAIATDRFIDLGIPVAVSDLEVGPYTFVLETLPYPSVAVRYGLFDDRGRLLNTARISLRTHLPSVLIGSNGLFFITGVKLLDADPPTKLQVYHASLSLRFGDFDLPFLP